MVSISDPPSWKSVLVSVLVTVVGGVIVAYIVKEGRFAANTSSVAVSQIDARRPDENKASSGGDHGARVGTPTPQRAKDDVQETRVQSDPGHDGDLSPSKLRIRGQLRWNSQPVVGGIVFLFSGSSKEYTEIAHAETGRQGDYEIQVPTTDETTGGLGVRGCPSSFTTYFTGDGIDLRVSGVIDRSLDVTKSDLKIISPRSGDRCVSLSRIEWQPYPGADHYDVHAYRRNENGGTEVMHQWSVSSTEFHASVDLSPGPVCISVSAVNSTGVRIADGFAECMIASDGKR